MTANSATSSAFALVNRVNNQCAVGDAYDHRPRPRIIPSGPMGLRCPPGPLFLISLPTVADQWPGELLDDTISVSGVVLHSVSDPMGMLELVRRLWFLCFGLWNVRHVREVGLTSSSQQCWPSLGRGCRLCRR